MAEMEGIEHTGEVEEKQIEEDEEEGEFIEGVFYKVNEHVTLNQPELCVIYTFLHYSAWNKVEIKQIVGHPLLELGDDMYDKLDLGEVIKCLRDEDDGFTIRVKVPAEEHRKHWLKWIPQLQKKYLNMCDKDDKSVPPLYLVQLSTNFKSRLAKQRDEERAAQRAASPTRPDKRRRTYSSIAEVMTGSSSQSQGDQVRDECEWDSMWDADDNKRAY